MVFSFIVMLGIGYGISHVVTVNRNAREKSDVTADDAEIYKNAAVAADAVSCSEVGKSTYYMRRLLPESLSSQTATTTTATTTKQLFEWF